MNNRGLFLGILIGVAVLIYLVGSFLGASFDITKWLIGYRVIAVVAYAVLVRFFMRKMTEHTK